MPRGEMVVQVTAEAEEDEADLLVCSGVFCSALSITGTVAGIMAGVGTGALLRGTTAGVRR